MSKQTVVDEIIKFCEKRINTSVSSHIGAYKDIIEFCKQALAMEKEQIKEGYIMALLDGDAKIRRDAEQYYNETYKGGQDEKV
jgi:hypothetical protein